MKDENVPDANWASLRSFTQTTKDIFGSILGLPVKPESSVHEQRGSNFDYGDESMTWQRREMISKYVVTIAMDIYH